MKKVLLIIIALILTGCQRNDKIGSYVPISKVGFFFDTVIVIDIYGEDKEKAEAVLDDCFLLAKDLEDTLSATVPDSDISAINKNAPNPVTVKDETAELISKALYFCELSDGYFDITMGNVTSMWDFTGEPNVPDEKKLKKNASYVNYENVVVDGNTVTLKEPNVSIDLGGIAKGYIADKMKELIVSNDIKSCIINLGGNVDIIGTRPAGDAFVVGIQDPLSEEGKSYAKVNATDLSVVTSGNYQRFFEINGKRYHHILDKNTGMPVENGVSSTTIISNSSTDCDALSTICYILGPKKGIELIDSLKDTEVMYIYENGEAVYSDGFSNYLTDVFE